MALSKLSTLIAIKLLKLLFRTFVVMFKKVFKNLLKKSKIIKNHLSLKT